MTVHGYVPTAEWPQDWSAFDLRRLFRRCASGDAGAREAIILRFLPYARRLARRYAGRGEAVEDLCQVATVGLIKAVDRYEPGRGEQFVAYAKPTIIGEIRRYFRDKTWHMHLPRSLRERIDQVARAENEMRATSGLTASTKEIANRLRLELAEVAEARRAAAASRLRSLDTTYEGNDGEPMAMHEAVGELELGYERIETWVSCASALRRLTPRDREVVLLRFGADFTQDEIARRMGISQVQVSRILRSALSVLAVTPQLQ